MRVAVVQMVESAAIETTSDTTRSWRDETHVDTITVLTICMSCLEARKLLFTSNSIVFLYESRVCLHQVFKLYTKIHHGIALPYIAYTFLSV